MVQIELKRKRALHNGDFDAIDVSGEGGGKVTLLLYAPVWHCTPLTEKSSGMNSPLEEYKMSPTLTSEAS